jgi:hypothetical protein
MVCVTKKHAPDFLHFFHSNGPASSSNILSAAMSYCEANSLPTIPEYIGLVCRLIVHYCMHNSPPVAHVFQETWRYPHPVVLKSILVLSYLQGA